MVALDNSACAAAAFSAMLGFLSINLPNTAL
jgi:hypothetical protein